MRYVRQPGTYDIARKYRTNRIESKDDRFRSSSLFDMHGRECLAMHSHKTILLLSVLLAACIVNTDTPMREFFDLPIPPTLAPVRKDASGTHYVLHQRRSKQVLTPGFDATWIEGYEGVWPGPTIVARRNEPVFVTQINELDHPVVVHNHGHFVTADSDGYPTDYIQPRAQKVYRYPNNQHASTYWLHDHSMHQTDLYVTRGLSSFYIIKDDEWDSLKLPSGKYDVPLLVQDRLLDGDQQLVQGVAAFGSVAFVNGARTPRLKVEPRKYLFRVLNGSSTRSFRLEFGVVNDLGRDAERVPFHVVASDGGLLNAPVLREDLAIAVSERFAIVMDFSKYTPGTAIKVRNRAAIAGTQANGTPIPGITDVMTFDVVPPTAPDDSQLPKRLTTIEKLPEDKVVQKRLVTLERQDGLPDRPRWTLNGREFDPSRIEFQVRSGDLEEWTILNLTNIPHVFHMHLVQFQIASLQGPPPEEQAGWKDSVFLAPFNQIRILMRWEGTPGIYPFHCHFLEHEDNAMMAQFELLPQNVAQR
jgi:spore coat protein A